MKNIILLFILILFFSCKDEDVVNAVNGSCTKLQTNWKRQDTGAVLNLTTITLNATNTFTITGKVGEEIITCYYTLQITGSESEGVLTLLYNSSDIRNEGLTSDQVTACKAENALMDYFFTCNTLKVCDKDTTDCAEYKEI